MSWRRGPGKGRDGESWRGIWRHMTVNAWASHNPETQRDPENGPLGSYTPFGGGVKSDPEFGHLSADLANNGVRLTQLLVIYSASSWMISGSNGPFSGSRWQDCGLFLECNYHVVHPYYKNYSYCTCIYAHTKKLRVKLWHKRSGSAGDQPQ